MAGTSPRPFMTNAGTSVIEPGNRCTEGRTRERIGESSRIDWSDVPLDEPLEPPLPAGRPLRIQGHLCFHQG